MPDNTRNDAEAARETEPLVDRRDGDEETGREASARGSFVRTCRRDCAWLGDTLRPLGTPSRLGPLERLLAAAACILLLLLLLFISLYAGKAHRHSGVRSPVLDRVCDTPACVRTSYELLESLNTSADPCEDFYEFTTGGWREKHPMKPSEGLFGIGQYVAEKNNEVLLELLESNETDGNLDHADQASLAKLRAYFGACMDEERQDKLGARPLLDELHGLMHVLRSKEGEERDSSEALAEALAWLHKRGIPALFSTSVEGDPVKAPRTATPSIMPDGLGLPDPAYYNETAAMANYTQIITETGRAVIESVHGRNVSDDKLAVPVSRLLVFEKHLASIMPGVTELDDPRATYNPMSLRDLKELVPAVDWEVYLHSMSPEVLPHKVLVANVRYLKRLQRLLDDTSTRTLHGYLYWAFVRQTGVLLGPNVRVRRAVQRLANLASGVDEDAVFQPRDMCAQELGTALGYMTGRFFVQKAFTDDARTQVTDMMESIVDAFYRRLPKLAWLDDATRSAARKKADAVAIKVGFPTNPDTQSSRAIRDWYASLSVTSKNHFANALAAQQFIVQRAWEQVGGELNDGLIGDLMPAEVNAEYNADKNEIAIPAGVVQKPYFGAEWPMYLQYGALGTTAGHELSHAFDPVGRLYDANGYLHDWWTPETAEEFDRRVRCLEEQYGTYTILDGKGGELPLNSEFTLSEDVADAGGLTQSFSAWKERVKRGDQRVLERNMRLPGLTRYTQEQLFFMAYGAAWARNIRTGESILRLRTDPHSPTRYRINGAVRNSPEFARAFGCRPGVDKMALRKEQRCEVW